jgi:hypothetical protein
MSKLQSQLALFGAIDQEVVDAKTRLREGATGAEADTASAILDLVGRFIPGATRFGQSGWYQELQVLVTNTARTQRSVASTGDSDRSDAPPAEPYIFPAVRDALDDLAEGDDENTDDENHDPVLARATFAAAVLDKIYGLTGERDSIAPLRILDRTLAGWTFESSQDLADKLKAQINFIDNRDEWVRTVAMIVGPAFAQASKPCFGALRKVDGRYCAYITTDDTADDLTVADVAKIVDPINWHNCCSFFCQMRNQNPKFTDGWSRLVERISGECEKYYLDTALVFWKQQLPDGSIYINYDLDTNRANDSMYVEVDSGYIWVSPLQPSGVRIRTSKLERVNGLSPTATAALACLMGWGTTGAEMLGGTARKRMKDPNAKPVMVPLTLSPDNSVDYH